MLFLFWAILVGLDKVPVEPFVQGLRDALIALGVFQAALTNPKE